MAINSFPAVEPDHLETEHIGSNPVAESSRAPELKLVTPKKSAIDEKIDELRSKRSKLQQGGGKQRIEKQHAAGKLTARERVAGLVDRGSFQEIGLFAKHRATLFGMEEKE